MPAYGLLSGLGQGLTQAAGTFQQMSQQETQNQNSRSLEELRAQKNREIEELRNKHQMERQEQTQDFQAGEAEKQREFSAQEGAADRASQEKRAAIRGVSKAENPEKEQADIDYKKQQVMDKKDAQAARILGVDDFALGMRLKKEPSAPQVKQLKRIYGDDLQIEKDDGGWFGRAGYTATSGGGDQLPEGVTDADIEFTMKKHGVSREEVLKRLQNK